MKHDIIAPVNFFIDNVDVWSTKTAKSLLAKGSPIEVVNNHLISVGYVSYRDGKIHTKDGKTYIIPDYQLKHYKGEI